ncbi:MAG: hypothetical protein HKN20_16055 [Gemmatimonadetes bacterium]|nr:hypothetical protein [Gemmatimonadota bacterium]
MNDTPNDRNAPDDIDAGEPIQELRDLEEEPRGDLLGRVVRGIERRVFAADAIDFSWFGLGEFLRELWNTLAGSLSGDGSPPNNKEESDR